MATMRPQYSTFQDNVIAFTKVLALLLLCALTGIWMTSCESKSGQLSKIPLEKVVIIDMYPDNNEQQGLHQYKVKRIEKGVTDVIYDARLFEAHDTIYKRFMPY